jgi:Zn finger protein HypA/HybF involved in hydrogenase expression
MADESKSCLTCKNTFSFNPFYSEFIFCPWCHQAMRAIMKNGEFVKLKKTKEMTTDYVEGWILV